jgi:AcrR family transcriptional regulator
MVMPKSVDIQKKRIILAQSATTLFLDKGYSKLTVSEVAQNAGIAKGSIYKYFDSKEDIVFAIIQLAQDKYDKEVLLSISNAKTIENKILALFDLCISNSNDGIKRRRLYKEFISICLDKPSNKMIEFLYKIKSKYITWLKAILQEGINNNILKDDAIKFANSLYVMGEGVLLFSSLDKYNNINLLQEHISLLLTALEKN